jgi:hypothetical protein
LHPDPADVTFNRAMFDDPVILAVIGIVVIGAIVGVVLFVRSRKPKEEAILHFRCPSCKRRLRYFARQAGHKGRCNSCKEALVFPAIVSSHR